jgi:hypothetical protein
MNKFDDIIERYFKGETTLSEENELKKYILSSDVKQNHKHLIPLFGFYQAETERTIPEKKVRKSKIKNNRYVKWVAYTGIAASVMLAVTLFNFNDSKDYAVIYGQKVNNEEYAQKMAVEKMNKVNKILERNLEPIESIGRVKATIRTQKANMERTKELIQSTK